EKPSFGSSLDGRNPCKQHNAGERTPTSKGLRPPAPKAHTRHAGPVDTGGPAQLARVGAAVARPLLPNLLPTSKAARGLCRRHVAVGVRPRHRGGETVTADTISHRRTPR